MLSSTCREYAGAKAAGERAARAGLHSEWLSDRPKGAAQTFNIVVPSSETNPAADHAIKRGRERCPQHSGTDARNGLYDKNGSGQQHPVWGFKDLKRCRGGCVHWVCEARFAESRRSSIVGGAFLLRVCGPALVCRTLAFLYVLEDLPAFCCLLSLLSISC